MTAIRSAFFIWLFSAGAALALDLSLEGAQIAARETTEAGSVRLPEAPWVPDKRPPEVEGAVTQTVLRSLRGTRTTLQLLSPIRAQLEEAGFEQVFTCADAACGGFDFRFQLDLIGEPEMHVDLGDYRYLLMRRDTGDPHTVSVVTSRSTSAGFVQITEVGAPEPDDGDARSAATIELGKEPEEVTTPADVVALMLAEGHVVLDDVRFASGSATLEDVSAESLDALAEWMETVPSARIALVGHTDSVGGAEVNRALSRRRAEAVRAALIRTYDIAPDRIEADGVGYLSPVAPNSDAEGRARNRRVEAVLLTLD